MEPHPQADVHIQTAEDTECGTDFHPFCFVLLGSNIALIAGILMAMSQRLLGRKRALYPALAGIACYALLVGGDAAVLRAALMGGLVVVAAAVNRRSTALVSLGAACWAMTLANPLALWNVGFQLSAAATAGLILFIPGVTAVFSKIWPGFRPGPLAQIQSTNPPITRSLATQAVTRTQSLLQGLVADGLIVTIAANITTLPLIVYHFGRLSPVSLLANFLILPVQPLITLWGSAAIVVGLAGLPMVAQGLAWVPWLCLVWSVAVVHWSAGLPGASLEWAGFGGGLLLLTYVLIFAVHWRARLAAGWRWVAGADWGKWLKGVRGPATLGVLSLAAILIWAVAVTQPDGRLHVYFLDIGQGDGIFIQTPHGRQVLIDGGGSPQRLFTQLGAVMPFWDRSLDLLVMTHADSDHMGSQPAVPQRYHVDYALETATALANKDSKDGAAWQAAMAQAKIKVQLEQAGGWIDLGDGVALWAIWPPAGQFPDSADMDNQNSLVLKLVYGDFSVLLTGDAGLPAEAVWVQEGAPLQATVLKVGHHGSATGTGPDLVAAVNPPVAVIQVGAGNKYGHPTAKVLQNLQGRLVLRNDLQGRIHIYSDGLRMWIETEKQDIIPR